jgi:serine protease Do
VIISQDDDNLYIATNNHVVEGATTITVSFIDDSTATAEVKGTDSSCDLAVVAIPLDSLTQDTLSAIKVATLGSSDDLSVGEGAIAIGNALGYGQSVTTGVISALDREVTLSDETTGQSITNDLIQTDAAINPGNSGGALLNMNGEVIGINSAKFASDEVEGMGFAIPISTAQPILSDLITREVVDEADSAYLGISGVDVDETVASTYNMPEGIYVAQVVEGSAAETAGLMKGDIITSFDGKTINSMEYLQEQMQYYAAGTQVEIVIERANNGQYVEQTLSVTLGSKK